MCLSRRTEAAIIYYASEFLSFPRQAVEPVEENKLKWKATTTRSVIYVTNTSENGGVSIILVYLSMFANSFLKNEITRSQSSAAWNSHSEVEPCWNNFPTQWPRVSADRAWVVLAASM